MYASSGAYSVGYREYHGPYISSPLNGNENTARRYVAIRWHGKRIEELGAGVANGVTADGTAVGADVLPKNGLANEPYAHGRLWAFSGAPVEVAADATASEARAIDARHRVVGVLIRGKRSYAFIWQNGVTRTLDDITHDRGWHFEEASHFTPDGAIIGKASYRGRPGVFIIKVP
jgi:hypothetical protein